MCGISGAVGLVLPFEKVKRLLLHRGPDEQTQWSDQAVHLIHTRLAIQELSPGGAQPMHLRNIHIAYNGEIYNHHELRESYGLKCRTHSDTETLLHLFERKGLNMLADLDGMFAMAIYDSDQCRLWLIRDRAGEKPLYYSCGSEELVFGSELKMMRELLRPVVDDQKIANFIAVGYLPTGETPYKGVYELPPGYFLEVNVKTLEKKLVKWWDILPAFLNRSRLGHEEALSEIDRLLTLSVKRRLTSSDLEVGSFLSGGIDSGLVTAIAARHASRLKTFTVSFDGMYNEAPLALAVSRHLGTQHYEIRLSFDNLEQDLEKIFDNYGEPIMDDSIIPSYYVARAAKSQLTVVLNGDAGDELFGGYRRYVPFTKLKLLSSRYALGRDFLKLLPRPTDKMNYYNYFYRLICLISSGKDHVYFSATNDLMHNNGSQFLVQPDLSSYLSRMNGQLDLPMSDLQKVMYLDFIFLLPAILLVKMDIATMAHSLEGRSPFLSKEILEFAPGLTDRSKVNGGQTKFLLRQLAKKYLPAEVVNQPKRGFEIPLKDWVDTRFRNVLQDYLQPNNAYVKTLVKPYYVDALLANKAKVSREQRARILFSWLSIERWKKQGA